MIKKVLAERGKRYGSFQVNSSISQELKRIIRDFDGKLEDHHREALDMICTKISRILEGDPNYADNWIDISGFATLEAGLCASTIKKL